MKAILAILDDFETIARKDGSLPWMSFPDLKKIDMGIFKEYTMGQDILMGRKTWENDLKGKPLKGRGKHFVLTSRETLEGGCIPVKNLVEIKGKDVVCIGGKSLYDAILENCDEIVCDVISLPVKINDGIRLQRNFHDIVKENGFLLKNTRKFPNIETMVFQK